MTDEPEVVPSTPVEPVAARKGSMRFHGHTHAQQGVHLAPEGVIYENPEVADLYERVKKALKDMGHEF